MNISEAIRKRILKFLRLERLAGNPEGPESTFINDKGGLKALEAAENRAWYIGDSNKLLAFYTGEEWGGRLAKDPLYNRNRANYFWGISPNEAHIKRVHSGLPRAIVKTLVAAIGTPTIEVKGTDVDVAKLEKATKVKGIVAKRQLPLTLAEGWGAFKVNMNQGKGHPSVEFYEGKDVSFVVEEGETVGIIYRDYYEQDGKNYVLFETRRVENGDSIIEYELFRLDRGDELKPVALETLERFSGGLRAVRLPGYGKPFGVPCKLIDDPDNPGYGESVFAGRKDMFDDLDQSLSQRSQTSRVSTPVEYYPADTMKRGPNGETAFPHVYNRQFIQMDFEQYTQEQLALVNQILIGLLSPATIGIDVSKRDNADAQREKEKITEMTRNDIMDPEAEILAELYMLVIDAQEYIDKGLITPKPNLEVSVRYPQFASPSFEGKSKALLPVWNAGAMSDELFVEKLYGETMGKKAKEEELGRIKAKRKESDPDTLFEDLMKSNGETDGKANG